MPKAFGPWSVPEVFGQIAEKDAVSGLKLDQQLQFCIGDTRGWHYRFGYPNYSRHTPHQTWPEVAIIACR
jgi:hypothetical protein